MSFVLKNQMFLFNNSCHCLRSSSSLSTFALVSNNLRIKFQFVALIFGILCKLLQN